MHPRLRTTALVPLAGLLTMVDVVELAADTEARAVGRVTEVVVTTHERPGTDRHVHRFPTQDGAPVDQVLTYRGSGGHDLEPGDRATLLLDSRGEVEPAPAGEVDPAGDRATIVVGGLLLAAVRPAVAGWASPAGGPRPRAPAGWPAGTGRWTGRRARDRAAHRRPLVGRAGPLAAHRGGRGGPLRRQLGRGPRPADRRRWPPCSRC